MDHVVELRTERLILRQWRAQDWPVFAKLNADPEVMAYFPSVLTAQESDGMAQKITDLIAEKGWGFWAVELIDSGEFIGFVGLNEPGYELPVTPCVEVGWRLAREYWGKGYATEAAQASLQFAFEELNLVEVYAFTSVANQRSRAVMERLNMENTGANFEHPIIPEGHPLREHVLYKVTRERWQKGSGE